MVVLDSSSLYLASTPGSKVALVDSKLFDLDCNMLDFDNSSMAVHTHSLHLDILICKEFYRMGSLGSIELELLAPVVVEVEVVEEQPVLVVGSKFLEGSGELERLLDCPPRLRIPRILADVHGSKVLGSSLGLLGSMDRMLVDSKVLEVVVGDSRREGWVFERSSKNSSSTIDSGTSHIQSIRMSIVSF